MHIANAKAQRWGGDPCGNAPNLAATVENQRASSRGFCATCHPKETVVPFFLQKRSSTDEIAFVHVNERRQASLKRRHIRRDIGAISKNTAFDPADGQGVGG